MVREFTNWEMEEFAMGKKKTNDRHKSGFLVRLPEAYREKLHGLKEKTDRPVAAMIRRAVDAYLKENGVEPPK